MQTETAAVVTKGVEMKRASRGKRPSVLATPLTGPLAAFVKKVRRE